MYLSIFLISLTLSIVTCYVYIFCWNNFLSRERIATGYGFLITLFLILIDNFFRIEIFDYKLYIILLLFSFIYWFDDLRNLSFLSRLMIQFFSGVLVGLIIVQNNDIEFNYLYIILIIFSGLISIFFTNVINFYDGSDLNVSLLVIIISLTFIFLINQSTYSPTWIVTLGFILGFIFFNFKPNTIFFGDSGCFVVSFLLNFMILDSVLNFNFEIVYLLIPFSLPIVDVFYVIFKKLKIKESLMTRNYYHLYQIIQESFQKKIYLFPQILNSMILYILSIFFLMNDKYSIIYFILLSFLITILVYTFIKKIFIKIYDQK